MDHEYRAVVSQPPETVVAAAELSLRFGVDDNRMLISLTVDFRHANVAIDSLA